MRWNSSTPAASGKGKVRKGAEHRVESGADVFLDRFGNGPGLALTDKEVALSTRILPGLPPLGFVLLSGMRSPIELNVSSRFEADAIHDAGPEGI